MNRSHTHLAIVILLAASLLAARASAQSSYTPTDIVVPAGDSFQADGMNDLGEVAGGYTPAGELELPAVWRNGIFTNLPLLPGAATGWARGINNIGQIVGACGSQACVWENGTVRALAPVAGTMSSDAWAINDAGTIVGHVYTLRWGYDSFREAVIWKGSIVAKLVPPTAGARTWARAIDSTGRVAVSWTTDMEIKWWSWGAGRWIPNVPNGTSGTMTSFGTGGLTYDINDSGVVSGHRGYVAYLWNGTPPYALDGLYPGQKIALGINNAGVTVGYNEDSEADVFTAWVAYSRYDMQDLNLLLTYSSNFAFPGSLASALSINNAGQILVQTVDATYTFTDYTLLTPSSQPPGPQNPAAPRYVSAQPAYGMVDLYWPGVYYAESYHVKRSNVSGGPYVTIASNIPSNTFRDTSVTNGTTYYYVVSAVNGSYESANSPETAAQLTGVVPSAPTSVLASAESGVIYVDWAAADHATGYNVKRATVSGGAFTTIATGNGLAFTDTSVVNGTRYFYVVSSLNGTYESGNSAEASAMPLATPSAPANLIAIAAKGGKSVNLAWQQSTSAAIQFNRVYRSVNGGLSTQIAQLDVRTTFADTSIARNSTYSYKVTAVNVNGQESPYSNTVTVTPK